MRVCLLTLCLFFTSVVPNGWSLSLSEEEKKMYKYVEKAYKAYREQKKAGIVLTSSGPSPDELLCIDCPKIKELTGAVNEILKKMMMDEDVSKDTKNALEAVESLEAMYAITFQEGSGDPNDNCEYRKLSHFGDPDAHEIKEEKILIFAKDVGLENFGAVHIRDGKNRTYFYRGEGKDRDIVIKVHVPAEGNVSVSYYRLANPITGKVKPKVEVEPLKMTQEEIERENERQRLKNYHGLWGNVSGQSEDGKDKFKAELGLALKTRNGLPKEVVLLEAEGQAAVGTAIVKGKGVVSSKSRRLDLKMEDGSGQEVVSGYVDDGMNAGVNVPLRLNMDMSVLRFDVGTQVNSERQIYYINHNQDLGNNGSISIRFQTETGRHNLPDEGKFWIRYKLDF